MIYKGFHIHKTEFAMYQIYSVDRFYQFDCLDMCQEFIDKLQGEELCH